MSIHKNVLVMGWYGAGNAGDEIILDTLKQWVYNFGARLKVLSIDPAHTRRMHDLDAVHMHDVRAVAQAMLATDLFILGGGGLLQTHQSFEVEALYSFENSDISGYARPVLMAHQMGKPIMMWAQGIGPLDTDASRIITKNLFSLASHISIRDEASKKMLADFSLAQPITNAPDPVWAWPMQSSSSPSKSSTTSSSCVAKKKIGIVVRDWLTSTNWQEKLIQAIRLKVDKNAYKLIWLSFHVNDLSAEDQHSLQFVKQMIEDLSEDYEQEMVSHGALASIVDSLSNCDAIVSMRLHANILACKLGKPLAMIAYDPKMQINALQIQMPERACVKVDAGSAAWELALEQLLSNPFVASEHLVLELSKAALAHRNLLKEALDAHHERSSSVDLSGNDFDWIKTWDVDRTHQLIHRQIEPLQKKINQLAVERHRERLEVEQLQKKSDQLETECSGHLLQITNLESNQHDYLLEMEQLKKNSDELMEKLSYMQQGLQYKERELQELKSSMSWRLMHPLRLAKFFMQSPRRALYQETRRIYHAMPSGAQSAIRPLKSAWIKKFSGAPTSLARAAELSSDMSWEEFKFGVLNQRARYKGIFVQDFSIDWHSPLYQRPQHMACAMGRLGYLVIYRTGNALYDKIHGVRLVATNVWATNCMEVDDVEHAITSIYSTAYALSVHSLSARQVTQKIVYEYIDHIDPQISGSPENISKLIELQKFAFGGGAHWIIASARKLYEECVSIVGEQKTILVQNGVDVAHYRTPIDPAHDLPHNYVRFKRQFKNIVGYFGALAPWLWYEAITELAKKRPDLGFVFIGPDYHGGSERLPFLSNILYLGAVDYRILPVYASLFDVCFIPFAPGEIARTTSPLKLFEYFALEKPVVTTSDMMECVSFAEVFSGHCASTLSVAIDKAIAVKADVVYQARLRELADQNSWDQRALAYEAVFKQPSDRLGTV
jgi:polysaccharide pyruvyl transferase CsaB